jgi:hypothetical protein
MASLGWGSFDHPVAGINVNLSTGFASQSLVSNPAYDPGKSLNYDPSDPNQIVLQVMNTKDPVVQGKVIVLDANCKVVQIFANASHLYTSATCQSPDTSALSQKICAEYFPASGPLGLDPNALVRTLPGQTNAPSAASLNSTAAPPVKPATAVGATQGTGSEKVLANPAD